MGGCELPPGPRRRSPLILRQAGPPALLASRPAALTSPGWLVRLHTAGCCCWERRERRGRARTAPRPRPRALLLLVGRVPLLLLLLRREAACGARGTRSCMLVAAAHCIAAVVWV